MKDTCLGEMMKAYDTLSLRLQKNIFFPYHSSILGSFQVIYGKKVLKILEAAVTWWLPQGQASECALDCLLEVESYNQICIDTNETEIRGYSNLLTDHIVLFFFCRHAETSKHIISGAVEIRCSTSEF